MSPKRFKKSTPGVKPFRLAKYFAITSFILLIIISIPFAIFISQKAKEDLFENYQEYAKEVGGNIDRQLFVNFMVPMLTKYGTIALSLKPQMEAFDKAVRKATESFHVNLINLYSLDEGFIIYSTDPSLIRKKTVKTEGPAAWPHTR